MAVSTFASTFGAVANERTLGLGLFQPPPVTTTTRPWFSISNPDGLTGFDRTQNEIIGHDLDAHRVFSSSFTTNPTTLLQPEIAAGRIPIWSFKPPASNVAANYATLAANLAALDGLILVSVDHEPENSMTAAQFESNWMDMHAGLGHLTNVWLGTIYMAVTATSTTRQAFRDLLDTLPIDFIGVDGYNSQNKRTFHQIFNWFALKARSRSVPWAVCEWSTHGTPAQRATHVQSGRTYWENPDNADLVIVSWFDSDGGNNAGPSGWRMERALPDDWAVIDGISRAVSPPPEYVEDVLVPAAIFDALQTQRRNVGPVAPPPPPTVPLQRGSLTVGTAEYPIPSGALYVAPGGSDGNGGLIGAPKATIAGAATSAPSGTTIVLRAGTYRFETVLPQAKDLTIQNYPGEAVWLCGSDVVTGWIQDNTGPGGTDRWRRNNWITNFSRLDAGDFADVSYPEAPWPEQVWIEDAPLEQVSTLADVGTTVTEPGAPGTFWYDIPNRRMWIGSTPFNKTVEIATRQVAISTSKLPTTDPPKITIRGIGIKHFAPSQAQRGAIQLHGPGSLVENCHVLYCSASGVFVNQTSGCQIRLTTLEGCGHSGYRAFRAPLLLIEQCRIYKNNRKRFGTTGAPGGGKIDTDCVDPVIRNNYYEKNWGHACWVDLYSHGAVIVGNEVYDHTLGAGIHFEMSLGAIIAGNWVKGCVHGILVSSSGDADVWNNTLLDNTYPLNYQLDDRADHRRFTARNNVVSQRVNYSPQTVYTGRDFVGNGRDWIEQQWTVDNNAVWVKFTQNYALLSVPGNTSTTFASQATLLAATDGIDENTVVTSGGTVDPYLNTDEKSPKPAIEGEGIIPPQDVIDALVAAGIWSSGFAAALATAPPNIGAY
jgi:hypothetical protein